MHKISLVILFDKAQYNEYNTYKTVTIVTLTVKTGFSGKIVLKNQAAGAPPVAFQMCGQHPEKMEVSSNELNTKQVRRMDEV